MPALPSIRSFNLKVLFLAHFSFIALSSMGFWSTSAFLFYNSILILLIVWSIHNPQNEEPLQLAIVVNGVSIFLDILLLVMCYPSGSNQYAREKFSAAMCILHLIIRPFSTIVMIKNLEERTGVPSGLFGGTPQQSSYEDIDKTVPHTSHSSQGGSYDFSSAQQI